MPEIILPSDADLQRRRELILRRPDNVRGKFGSYVTSDVYHIADRIREIPRGENLSIQVLDPPVVGFGRTYNFAIVEYSLISQQEELVMRVETLDARIIESLERMLRIPFKQRFAAMEKEEEKWAKEEKERELNELYERMGGNMRIQLERCGFTDPWGPKYAPMNRTARRHRARASA